MLRRSEGWVFGPHETYERSGDVNDIVFPSAKMEDIMRYIRECPEEQCPDGYCRFFEGHRDRCADPE